MLLSFLQEGQNLVVGNHWSNIITLGEEYKQTKKEYSKNDTSVTAKVVYEYEPKVDKLIQNENNEIKEEMFEKIQDSNRPLFSEETTKKIMAHIHENEELLSGSKEN